MWTKLLLAGLLLLLGSSSASAQVSVWLQRGTSGFGASASLASGGDVTSIGVHGGYSYQGFLDFNLGLLRHSFDDDAFAGADVAAYGLAPSVEYHPLKQGPNMPVSVGVGAGFQYFIFESDDFAPGVELEGWTLTLTGSVYRFFRLGETTGVIPTAALIYAHSTTTLSNDFDSVDDSDDSVALGLNAYFALLSGKNIFGLVPFIIIGDDVTLGINLAVIFSQPGD